jgi:hypothetical protein
MMERAGIQQGHKELRPKREPCLGSKRAFNNTIRQTLGWEVAKQAVKFSIRLQKISDWTLWRT